MAEEESGCFWMDLQCPGTRNTEPVGLEEGLPCALFSGQVLPGFWDMISSAHVVGWVFIPLLPSALLFLMGTGGFM